MKLLTTLCLLILLCSPCARDAFAQMPATQEANPAAAPTQAVPPGKTATPPEASSTPSPMSPATEPQAALNETNNETNNEAAAPRFASKTAPVHITRFETAPIIDGQINEREWSTAAHFGDFVQTQPGDNVAPSQPTEVMMGYDAKNLYLAFRASEAKGKVRSTVARRDNIFDDDTVRVVLDTFDDQRQGYIFVFNPLGIQADGVLTEGRGEDYSVDIVMESKGVLNEDGYTIEVAIPFKSLRYEAGKSRSWGIHIFRRIKHNNNELDSWMPISRNRSGLLNQAGRITGLEGISTTRQLEIIPSLTLSQTGTRTRTIPVADTILDSTLRDSGRFVNGGLDFDPGLTAKFGLTPTTTLDFALNPDFAQVEADATVVTANQRFPIFFPEKRPFFLERIDIFQTRLSVVNTRAIVDPDVAVKLTGRRGANTFGILAASDNFPGFGAFTEDQRTDPTLRRGVERFLDKNSYIGIVRLKRDIGRQHNLGLIATSYTFPERHNHTGGVDGRFRLDPQTIVEFQVLGTTSRRNFFDSDLGRSLYRTGNGFGYSYLFDRSGRNLSVQFNGVGRTRDYRADVGFTPRTNTNQHRSFIRYVTEQQPKQRIIFKRLSNETVTSFDWQGRLQNWETNTQGLLALQRQTAVGIGFEGGYERVFEEEFGARRNATRAGTFFGEDSERSAYSRELYGFIETSPNKQFFGLLVLGYTQGQLDFDFGAGPRFPRASRAALAARADPQCISRRDEQGRELPVPAFCSQLDPGKGDSLFIESSFRYQPTNLLRLQLDYNKQRLVRDDTNLTAFDDNIFSLRGTYQFTRNTFARARLDYSTLATLVRPQLLFGYTPNPGTALFIGYNDDLNRNGFNPFSREPVFEPGFRRNGRTFFIKASYLIRKEL